MEQQTTTEKQAPTQLSPEAIKEGKEALSRLPILGPITWLYARDPLRKYMFMSDIDWNLMPPVVLDQCRLYNKDGIPFAYVSWAYVSDQVATRLQSKQPKIAPHEWQSGEHVWLIDVVTPFGQLDETIDELRQSVFAGKPVNALILAEGSEGVLTVKSWPAAQATN